MVRRPGRCRLYPDRRQCDRRPGTAAPEVFDDYCGNLRDDGANDIGALEYDDDFDCDTTTGGGSGPALFADGFEG